MKYDINYFRTSYKDFVIPSIKQFDPLIKVTIILT